MAAILGTCVHVFFLSAAAFVCFMAGRYYEARRLLRLHGDQERRYLQKLERVRDELRKRG